MTDEIAYKTVDDIWQAVSALSSTNPILKLRAVEILQRIIDAHLDSGSYKIRSIMSSDYNITLIIHYKHVPSYFSTEMCIGVTLSPNFKMYMNAYAHTFFEYNNDAKFIGSLNFAMTVLHERLDKLVADWLNSMDE